jgi:hypothetical protein
MWLRKHWQKFTDFSDIYTSNQFAPPPPPKCQQQISTRPQGITYQKTANFTTFRTYLKAFSTRFKNAHSKWSYQCTPYRVNVFGRGITLPGHAVVSLAATTPCQLQAAIEGAQLANNPFTTTKATDHKYRGRWSLQCFETFRKLHIRRFCRVLPCFSVS